MQITRNRLYTLLLTGCFFGYIWLFYNINLTPTDHQSVGVCIVKQVANIPCPSCGSTRSIVSIIHGDFIQGLLINPLGFVIMLIMLISPIWILLDVINNRETLRQVYVKIENKLKKTKIAAFFILLIVANWIWNIMKGM